MSNTATGCALAAVIAVTLVFTGFLFLHAALTGGLWADLTSDVVLILLALLSAVVVLWRAYGRGRNKVSPPVG